MFINKLANRALIGLLLNDILCLGFRLGFPQFVGDVLNQSGEVHRLTAHLQTL
jgi:hypothetical protein